MREGFPFCRVCISPHPLSERGDRRPGCVLILWSDIFITLQNQHAFDVIPILSALLKSITVVAL
jgi:hypothetical protein